MLASISRLEHIKEVTCVINHPHCSGAFSVESIRLPPRNAPLFLVLTCVDCRTHVNGFWALLACYIFRLQCKLPEEHPRTQRIHTHFQEAWGPVETGRESVGPIRSPEISLKTQHTFLSSPSVSWHLGSLISTRWRQSHKVPSHRATCCPSNTLQDAELIPTHGLVVEEYIMKSREERSKSQHT